MAAARRPPSHPCSPPRCSAATCLQSIRSSQIRCTATHTLLEQENPQQRDRHSSLDQTTHTRGMGRKAPQKLRKPNVSERHIETRIPQANSAGPKKVGQPHTATPNASHGYWTKFPDRVVWVWKFTPIAGGKWSGRRDLGLWRWLVCRKEIAGTALHSLETDAVIVTS
jgi:hypothetical protein